jgi:hypothetical protein
MSAKTRTQTLHIACTSAVRATSQILGEVRSGEVQGDLVGKAAPAGRPKSDCNDKQAGEIRRKHGWAMLKQQAKAKYENQPKIISL